MTHAMRARKERGAKLVVIDIYRNATMEQADMALLLRPGTDGALACRGDARPAARRSRRPRLYGEVHRFRRPISRRICTARRPNGPPAITGLTVAEIEAFARLVGTTPHTYFRLGYGFTRQRNGATAMHAALSHSGHDRRLAASRRRRLPFQFAAPGGSTSR